MINKVFKCIVFMFLITLFLVACSSEYDKTVRKYESLYNKTTSLLDSENVYKSIKENKLTSNLEQLDKLFEKAEKSVPDSKIKDLMVLRQEHETITEIIEKGLIWDKLDDLDKIKLKQIIEIRKPKD